MHQNDRTRVAQGAEQALNLLGESIAGRADEKLLAEVTGVQEAVTAETQQVVILKGRQTQWALPGRERQGRQFPS